MLFEYRGASLFGAGQVWLAGCGLHMQAVGVHSMNTGLKEAWDRRHMVAGAQLASLLAQLGVRFTGA